MGHFPWQSDYQRVFGQVHSQSGSTLYRVCGLLWCGSYAQGSELSAFESTNLWEGWHRHRQHFQPRDRTWGFDRCSNMSQCRVNLPLSPFSRVSFPFSVTYFLDLQYFVEMMHQELMPSETPHCQCCAQLPGSSFLDFAVKVIIERRSLGCGIFQEILSQIHWSVITIPINIDIN